MTWGLVRTCGVVVGVLAASVVSGCSSPDGPTCDAFSVEQIEGYVGASLTQVQEEGDERPGDVQVCKYETEDGRASISIWIAEREEPLDERHPEEPEVACKPELVDQVNCSQTGEVGGESWCVFDMTEVSSSIYWMKGDFALAVLADAPGTKDESWKLQNCDDMEDFATEIDAAVG